MKKKHKTRPIAHDGAETETRAQQFKDVVVIYEISRFEIEHCVTERLVHDLRVDPENPFIHAGPGRVIFQVCGYDDDPRELFQIPEFRAFLRKADKSNPCWLYYGVAESYWLHVVSACTAPGLAARLVQGGNFPYASVPEAVVFLNRQLDDYDRLFKLAEVRKKEAKAHLKESLTYFGVVF